MDTWIDSKDSLGVGIAPLVYHGAPGCGLSAFLAGVWREQVVSDKFDAVLIHFAEVDGRYDVISHVPSENQQEPQNSDSFHLLVVVPM